MRSARNLARATFSRGERKVPLVYTEEEIRGAVGKLVEAGVDVDGIPGDCTVDDLFRMVYEFGRPQ